MKTEPRSRFHVQGSKADSNGLNGWNDWNFWNGWNSIETLNFEH